jgi:signal transduction histidine kinase
MKLTDHMNIFLQKIYTFPLILLHLSMRKRLLIVLITHGLGIAGLWFFFPVLNDAASMILPIICLCWLFSYRGLLISFCSTSLTVLLIYHYLYKGTMTPSALMERIGVGLAISLLLSLTICWLRTAVDLVHAARQQTLTAEQKHLHALEAERQITLAYEQQRMLNEQKDQLLLHVSHELRTPLTVLGCSLELFKEYFEQLDPVKRTEMLTQALGNYEDLVGLVNGMLDTIAVTGEFPSAHCERVAVRQVVQEALAHLEPSDVEAYTIYLHVDEQVLIWADQQYLYRVLQNLLSNIFKYVPVQTAITIEATQTTPSSPVCLSVQDEGPGIPPEELPSLFEKFMRLKRDLAGARRGTGLGLYICKQLVEAMGGRMWVESSGRMGEGSRFCVSLLPVNGLDDKPPIGGGTTK